MVKTQVYRLGRQVRDSWLNWPARVSALMAADLGIDEHALHQALERYVREHLNDIGEENSTSIEVRQSKSSSN